MNDHSRIGWNFKTNNSFTLKEYKSIFTSLKGNSALFLYKGLDIGPSLWLSKDRDYNLFIMPSGHIQIQTFITKENLSVSDAKVSFDKTIALFIENNFNFELLKYMGCYFNKTKEALGLAFMEEISLMLASRATFLFSAAPEVTIRTIPNLTYCEVTPRKDVVSMPFSIFSQASHISQA